ncbi:hypothetical protein FRC03_012652 [Tulasnella sp. 419]|nr:hypothetical protein FRC03_012652 [Tulasnella sp. 419]
MQSVLSTPELVAMMMEFLGEWNPDEERAQELPLRSCITVNRIFSREALRLIWRDIAGLSRLIYLLPSEAYTILPPAAGDIHRLRKLQRNVDFDLSKHSAWERILEVTPRVRRCHFSGGQFSRIFPNQQDTWDDLTFMQSYQRTFPDRPLFPRLIHLHANLTNQPGGLSGLVNHCPTLLTATIQFSYIRYHSAIEARRMGVSLRTLTSLESLTTGQESPLSQDALEILLQRNARLKQVFVKHAVQLRHIQLICMLRNLRLLHLDGGIKSLTAEMPSRLNSSETSCPLLEELRISASIESVQTTLMWLQSFRTRPTKKLEVVTSQSSAQRISSLLDAVGIYADTRLEAFRLTTSWGIHSGLESDDEDDETNWVLPSEALNPLYELKNLGKLFIEIGMPIDLVDDDISRMLLAFPRIEELYLSCNPEDIPIRFATRLSSNCLVQLAVGGPKLRKIGLLVNEEWIKMVDTCYSQSLITEVDFGRSTPPFTLTAHDVAGQLVDIFPRIEQLRDGDAYHESCDSSGWCKGEDEDICKWAKISSLLPGLKKSREWATKRTLGLLGNVGQLRGAMTREQLEHLLLSSVE